MKMDLKKIIQTECAGFAVILLAASFTIFQARIVSVRVLNKQIKASRTRQIEISSPESKEKYNMMKRKLELFKKDMSSMKERMDSFKTRLPVEINISALLEDVNKKAKSNKLELVSVKPESEQVIGEYKKMVVGVKLRGRYSALLNYVSDIVGFEKYVYLNRVSLGTDAVIYPDLDIELVIVAFSR